MELNTNWQTITSAGLISNVTISVQGRITSQSTSENYSDTELRIINYATNSAQWRTTSGTANLTGAFSDSVSCATYPNYVSNGTVLLTVQKRIYHDADGSKSFTIGGHVDALLGGTRQYSNPAQTAVSLPKIDRYGYLTGATDFNDEQNPTIWYSNPLGDNVTTLEAYIEKEDLSQTLVYARPISKTGNAYIFELTAEERGRLRNATPNSASLRVHFVIHTKLGNDDYYSALTRTMTIVNGNPTFNVAYQDTNATTTAITQNNQQIIQNNSTLQVNITSATALKGASLSTAKVTINGVTTTQSISSSTLNINIGTLNLSSNTNATVSIIDSRGLTTTKTLALTILGWTLPTGIVILNRQQNYYTETDINVDATYSSLDSKNTLTIQYRIKKTSDNSWGNWNNLSDNTTATFNADNQYSWDVQVKVQDSIGSTTYNLSIGVGTPIFFVDREKHSIGLNGFPENDDAVEIHDKLYLQSGAYKYCVNEALNDACIHGGGGVSSFDIYTKNGYGIVLIVSSYYVMIITLQKGSQTTNNVYGTPPAFTYTWDGDNKLTISGFETWNHQILIGSSMIRTITH